MKGLEAARRMLRMAERNLRLVKAVVDNTVIDDSLVGFDVQQAMEKSLKAWLAAVGAEYPFSHDLGLLLDRLRREGQKVESFRKLAAYSLFAVQMRYDDFGESEAATEGMDRPTVLQDARALFDHVARVIQSAESRS